MTIRLFVALSLQAGAELPLPSGAARHAQVRRVQPGEDLVLFDGGGSDWPATVLAVGRSEVRVRVGLPVAVASELQRDVTLALGMPANERMDVLVEKATELGVARVQPLLTHRSVLRLGGDRADRKREHWQAVAQAACEQWAALVCRWSRRCSRWPSGCRWHPPGCGCCSACGRRGVGCPIWPRRWRRACRCAL